MKQRNFWVISVCLIMMFFAASCEKKEGPQESKGKYLFTTPFETKKEAGKTFVIQCNEEKFQKPFEEFIKKGLKIEAESFSLPGGSRLFAMPTEVPEELKPLKRVLIEVLKRHSPEKIILITHSDCLVDDIVAAWKNKEFTKEQEIEQAKKASEFLKEYFPKTKIEIYYAEVEGNNLGFTAVR